MKRNHSTNTTAASTYDKRASIELNTAYHVPHLSIFVTDVSNASVESFAPVPRSHSSSSSTSSSAHSSAHDTPRTSEAKEKADFVLSSENANVFATISNVDNDVQASTTEDLDSVRRSVKCIPVGSTDEIDVWKCVVVTGPSALNDIEHDVRAETVTVWMPLTTFPVVSEFFLYEIHFDRTTRSGAIVPKYLAAFKVIHWCPRIIKRLFGPEVSLNFTKRHYEDPKPTDPEAYRWFIHNDYIRWWVVTGFNNEIFALPFETIARTDYFSAFISLAGGKHRSVAADYDFVANNDILGLRDDTSETILLKTLVEKVVLYDSPSLEFNNVEIARLRKLNVLAEDARERGKLAFAEQIKIRDHVHDTLNNLKNAYADTVSLATNAKVADDVSRDFYTYVHGDGEAARNFTETLRRVLDASLYRVASLDRTSVGVVDAAATAFEGEKRLVVLVVSDASFLEARDVSLALERIGKTLSGRLARVFIYAVRCIDVALDFGHERRSFHAAVFPRARDMYLRYVPLPYARFDAVIASQGSKYASRPHLVNHSHEPSFRYTKRLETSRTRVVVSLPRFTSAWDLKCVVDLIALPTMSIVFVNVNYDHFVKSPLTRNVDTGRISFVRDVPRESIGRHRAIPRVDLCTLSALPSAVDVVVYRVDHTVTEERVRCAYELSDKMLIIVGSNWNVLCRSFS